MVTVRVFRPFAQFFRHYVPTEVMFLAVFEFLLLVLSLYLGLETRYLGNGWQNGFGPFLPKAFLFATTMELSLIALGAYQRHTIQFYDVVVLRIAASLLLGLIPLGASFYVAPGYFLGRGVVVLAVGYGFAMIVIVRLVLLRLLRMSDFRPRILVLGSGETADLVRKANKNAELIGLNIVGYMPFSGDRHPENPSDRIASEESLIDYVEKNHIDEIVLAVDDRRAGLPSEELLDCKMSGINVFDLQTFFERRMGKIHLEILQPSWLYLSDGFRECRVRNFAKRTFDIVMVLLLLPIALPLMVIAGGLIFLESRGRESIIYQQTRVGRGGRPFQIYKFRSMVADAEGDGMVRWAAKNDARITWIGALIRKGRLDEMPQLYNIVKGDMSFVGPRPERPEFVEQLAANIPYYNERHRVKPGLTGWAQIHYPYGSSEEDAREKLQYDLYYIKNYNLLLDLLILLQTAEVVLLGKGAQ